MRISRWLALVLGGTVVVIGGGVAALVAAASPRAVPPTAAELHANGVTFVPGPVPSGALTATQATNDLLVTHGGHWTKFPSAVHAAHFGYVTNSQIRALSAVAVSADPSLQAGGAANAETGLARARVNGVAVWEITFGGLQLPTPAPDWVLPGPKPKTDGSICKDETAFVDAKTGHALWETWNDCTPVPTSVALGTQ